MNSIGMKIKELRKACKLTQSELSRMAKISRSYLADVESGRYNPSIETLGLIARALAVDTAELLGTEPKEKTSVSIGVYGKIPAGIPVSALEDVLGREEIPVDWTLGGKEYIALEVKGDSMYPKYLEGDVVILRLQSTCENGQDAAVYVGDFEATLKKVLLKEEQTILMPLNPQYDPMIFNHGDHNLQILGVVVELRRKILN